VAENLSFLGLLKVHKELDEMFLCHQEALLSLDICGASEILARYKPELLTHMKHEEDLLLPLYQARAGRIPGGPVELFLGEHKKMMGFIDEFQRALFRMRLESGSQLKRSIIALMDRESVYKCLVEHHSHREKNILYPWLDRVTTEEERGQLLKQCRKDETCRVDILAHTHP
jgi:hemerythrin-like domain-containing protein